MDVTDIRHEVTRLDVEYIEALGQAARALLLEGQAAAVTYTPGNGSQYDLVLTPGSHLVQLPGMAGDEVPRGFSDLHDVVVLAITNFTDSHPWALDLLGRGGSFLAPWYTADKLGVTQGDAIAITALLAEIADNPAVLYGTAIENGGDDGSNAGEREREG